MIIRNTPFYNANIQQNQQNNAPANQVEKQEAGESLATNAPINEGENKVDNIKSQVENGTYKIDINKTADKMAQDLLLDIKVYK